MAKKLMTLMFNKDNGELIGGYETDNAPKTVFENVRLKTLEYDPDRFYYRGTYEEGGLIAIPSTDDSIIDEEQLDINVGQTIYTRYPAHKQINIIRRALQNMWGAGAPKEFLDMCSFMICSTSSKSNHLTAFNLHLNCCRFIAASMMSEKSS